MKILDLKLKAFGPFLNEVHIPFESLNDKGMFLINGPTGTGKTSIFDAIIYALYGKASGEDRDDAKTLKSDFASEEDIAYVELTFEANGKVYKVKRVMEYSQKKSKGTGFTIKPATAQLSLPDGTIIEKVSEVNDKIENEILFINRNQFKNIALLAQGEFTKLVTVKGSERAKILEHIFGKEIYDKFTIKLGEIYKAIEKEKNSRVTEVNTLISQVEDGESIICYQEAIDDPSNIPDFINNLDLKIKEIEKELLDKKNERDISESEYNKVNDQLKSIRHDNDLIKKYLNALAALKELKEKENDFNKLQILLDKQLEVDALTPLYKQLNKHKEEIGKLKDSIKDINDKLEKLKETENNLAKEKESYLENKKALQEIMISLSSLKDIKGDLTLLINDKKVVESKDEEFAKQYKIFEEEEKKYQAIRDRFFASTSYNLAKDLKEGSPCPVCGSLSHPHPATFIDPISESEFKAAEKYYQTLDKNIRDLKSKLDSLKIAFNTKEDNLINKLVKNGFADANKELIYSNKIDELIANKISEKTKLDDLINGYERRVKELENNKTTLTSTLSEKSSALKTREANLLEASKDIDDKLNTNKHIKSVDDYSSYLQSEDKLLEPVSVVSKKIETYKSSILINQTTINNTPTKLIESGMVDEGQLVIIVNEKLAIFDQKKDEFVKLEYKHSSLTKSLTSIKAAYNKCSSVIERYSSIYELNKVTNGSNRLKLSFKMYVLADYFDKIIAQANVRLAKITNGRYFLSRSNEIKGNGQKGLDLDVYDIETGKYRAASSLSGGEKFVSALSLALGLSDIIETSHALVQVESIFIDEGFGSLDDEYLDMAMQALETLKTNNKTVAIISHVEKLKQYISTGLEVKKDDVGSKVIFKDNI